jgi:hypothetical protein
MRPSLLSPNQSKQVGSFRIRITSIDHEAPEEQLPVVTEDLRRRCHAGARPAGPRRRLALRLQLR